MEQSNFDVRYYSDYGANELTIGSDITDENFSQYIEHIISTYPNVKKIIFNGNNKFNNINSSIGRLQTLESINKIILRKLNKNTELPIELFTITQLQGLEIHVQSIRNIPLEILQLRQLRELDLHTEDYDLNMNRIFIISPLIKTLRKNNVRIYINSYRIEDDEQEIETAPVEEDTKFSMNYMKEYNLVKNTTTSGVTNENFSQFINFIVSNYPDVSIIILKGNPPKFNQMNSSIGKLKHIRTLEILNISNVNEIPIEVFDIVQLRGLYIQIKDLYSIPNQIFQLKQLQHLHLYIDDFNPNIDVHFFLDVPVIKEISIQNKCQLFINDEFIDLNFLIVASQELPPEPSGEIHDGVAFQIHNAFNTLFEYLPAREYFSQIIELIKPYNLKIPEINHPYGISNKYTIIAGVYNCMAHMIYNIYNGDQDKRGLIQKYNMLFQQIYMNQMFNIYSRLIFMNLILIISLNHIPLINLYVETYVKDCMEAYQGTHTVSCQKGIIERYILNFKQSVQILCCNGNKCENPKLETICSMFTFMDINNHILLNDLIREWTQSEDSIEYNTQTPESRRNSLIDYLMNNVFGRNITVPSLLETIRENIIKKLSKDPFDKMNFECKDKLETVIDPEDCEKGIDVQGGGRKRKNHKKHIIRHSRKKKMNKKQIQTHKHKSKHFKKQRTRKIQGNKRKSKTNKQQYVK
jgi:hypothetical protein